MPFGLKNAAQTFQRFMDSVLRDLHCTFVYLDDILVASSTKEQQLSDLEYVRRRLLDNSLVLCLEKCVFGFDNLDFLGHRISPRGIQPLPCKVDAISEFPQPTTQKGLSEFLGMVNVYHRFLPSAAHTLHPLYASL